MVCHGLEGNNPSDDQYGINHCIGSDFWDYSSNEYTNAGKAFRHITHPSDFVCWFIPSMGHLVWRFTALLTTWLLKVSWQPLKLTHTNCAWSLAGQVDNILSKTSGYKEIARFVPFWCCHECHDQSALWDERSDWFQDIRCFHRPPALQRTNSCFLFLHRSGGHCRFCGDEYPPAINHY